MAGERMLADIRERLYKKSIHEVRLIARAVGVRSPTDGKKNFIIDKIMEIASCKAIPAPRTARGAPPKSNDFDEALVSDIRECIRLFTAKRAQDTVPEDLSVSDGGEIQCSGILNIGGKYSCLCGAGCLSSADDIYVAETVVNRFNLKRGDRIDGICRLSPGGQSRTLAAITSVNGFSPDAVCRREFEALTPVYPVKRICLETSSKDICARMADLFAPMGFGQRAVISAPSSFSKTTLIKQIAAAVSSDEKAKIIIFFVGGYPEQITDIRRALSGADVFSTSLSASAEENKRASELVTSYAKRLAESGRNAVLIVPGLSALGSNAMNVLSCAINAEEGGSLTVIGTVNAAGDYCSEHSAELLNAANMRLVICPGFFVPDISQSFTLGSEYLQTAEEIKAAESLRYKAANGGLDEVINIFKETESNAEIVSNGR